MNHRGKATTVLITGTTSGIGYELSKLFAADGCRLVLVSRNEQRLGEQKQYLEKKYGATVYVIASDLSDPQAPEQIYQTVADQDIHVDILVNNAGFNESGLFIETDLTKELQMLQVLIVSLTHLTKLFLPGMVKNRYGKILNVGSTGSFAPCPLDAVYAAAKSYVLSFSNAIRAELRGTGVSVSTLCPGATSTEFAKKANMEKTLLFHFFVMKPHKVAQIGYRGLMNGRKVIITGAYNKMLVLSMFITPSAILNRLSMKLLQRNSPGL